MKPGQKIRVYDKEFKLNAVKLYTTGECSLSQVSEELGIPNATLAGWVQSYQTDKGEAFPGKGHLKPSDAEVARLTKELVIVREERDILKKALGIFSSLRK
jgi:transposase